MTVTGIGRRSILAMGAAAALPAPSLAQDMRAQTLLRFSNLAGKNLVDDLSQRKCFTMCKKDEKTLFRYPAELIQR